MKTFPRCTFSIVLVVSNLGGWTGRRVGTLTLVLYKKNYIINTLICILPIPRFEIKRERPENHTITSSYRTSVNVRFRMHTVCILLEYEYYDVYV